MALATFKATNSQSTTYESKTPSVSQQNSLRKNGNNLRNRVKSHSDVIYGHSNNGKSSPSPSPNENSVTPTDVQLTDLDPNKRNKKNKTKSNNNGHGTIMDGLPKVSLLAIFFEGDLAGFQIFWICMSVVFFFLKILLKNSDIFKEFSWSGIFLIPICNSILTGVFDYIIRKYHSKDAIESLKKRRFLIVFMLKFVLGVYIFAFYLWGSNGFTQEFIKPVVEANQYDDSKIFSPITACKFQIFLIFVALCTSIFACELMITTCVVNSGQNLSPQTPRLYNVILWLIRPIVWVYNRTMSMFICFYAFYGCFYGLFVIGAVCDRYCTINESKELQSVGLKLLTVPFTRPDYLFYFSPAFFNRSEDIKSQDLMEQAVLMFLSTSFFMDILNSCYMFFRPILTAKYLSGKHNNQKNGKNLASIIHENDGTHTTTTNGMNKIAEVPELENAASNQL